MAPTFLRLQPSDFAEITINRVILPRATLESRDVVYCTADEMLVEILAPVDLELCLGRSISGDKVGSVAIARIDFYRYNLTLGIDRRGVLCSEVISIVVRDQRLCFL